MTEKVHLRSAERARVDSANIGASGSSAGTSNPQQGSSGADGSGGGSQAGAAGEGGTSTGSGGFGGVGGSPGGLGGSGSSPMCRSIDRFSRSAPVRARSCARSARPTEGQLYDVTVEVGDASSSASSLVAAETRHYAGPAVPTAGPYALVSFTVNVRHEKHDGGQSAVADVLDLSIGGASPKLHGIGLKPAPSSIAIFVAGDSTVCDWVATNTSAGAPDELAGRRSSRCI